MMLTVFLEDEDPSKSYIIAPVNDPRITYEIPCIIGKGHMIGTVVF